MGDGWQSLVRLAALDVLSQFPDQMKSRVVLLFEEPETHLHPHLRRRMRDVLEKLASGGWCVVTTTHAPEFVDLGANQRIVKLRRSQGDVAHSFVDSTTAPNSIQIQAKVNEQGNGELFFANKVVICEGKDDEFALRSMLEMLEVDLDGRSISILSIGGRDNAVDYARLLRSIGTSWCAVTDEDKLPDGTIKEASQKTREELESLKREGDVHLQWPIDLEHCFGIARNAAKRGKPEFKAGPDWQAGKLSRLSKAEVERQFPELYAVSAEVAKWIEET